MRTLFVAAALFALAGAEAPSGYTIVPDKASADLSKAVYTASGSNWDVTTGPAHIIFSEKDAATGSYAVSATIEQLAKPTHPEAYGLFLGGKDLADSDKRTYTYFVVRGTGEYLVKVMNGSKTTTVTNWTANENIPERGREREGDLRAEGARGRDRVPLLRERQDGCRGAEGDEPGGGDRRASDKPQSASDGHHAGDGAVVSGRERDAPAQRQRVPPWGRIQRSAAGSPAASQAARARSGGSSSDSSVSLKVPQWMPTMIVRWPAARPA